MPIPNADCIFSLDGQEFKGAEAFLDHILRKDVNITPTQEEADIKAAKEYGFSHPTEAINSVNKRLGTDYKTFSEIPEKELKQAATERKGEKFDDKVDKAAAWIIKSFSAQLPEGTQKAGIPVDFEKVILKAADIIKKAYHAKEDIQEAIQNAIDYIKKNWDKTWGELNTDEIAQQLYDLGGLTVDEEIERTLGVTPQDVLNIWNSVDAGAGDPQLLEFIKKLSTDEKKTIVKDALKGIVSDKLSQFIRTIKEKTGAKVDIASMADLKQTIQDKINAELRKQAKLRADAQKEIEDAIRAATKSKSFADHIRTSNMLAKVKEFVKGVGLMFHPAMYEGKELAREAMMVIRKEKGKEAHQNELADMASRQLMNDWNFIPKKEKLGFILSLENPLKYGEVKPEYQAIAKEYAKRMDDVFDMLSQIKDLPYIEDYFPHFWKRPEKARAMAQAYSKAPLEGNKSFLKRRFYSDVLEGLKAKLELATDNPEEMVRLAEMNALKFKTAHDIFGEMKDRGLIKFYRLGQQPEGWKLVDDPLFKRMALFTVKGDEGLPDKAALSQGGYYMPEPVARVVNNYLSRGLSGAGPVWRNLYAGVRAWNNIKNLFQLGLGFFHATTTTVDSTVTGFANGINKLLAGEAKGIIDVVKSFTILPNIAEQLVRGDKTIRDKRHNVLTSDVQAMIDANARTGLSKIYTLDSYYNLKKGIGRLYADKDLKAIPGVILNALLFLPEAAGKPLMEWYVPRLKVGGYLRTLEMELNNKKALTPDEITREKQKGWDDMDDRLGQMVYDNIFWHKTMKDLAFLTIRSFGWTGGTIRAFGKGIRDIPESIKRQFAGQGISPRTAWLISLPTIVGMYGAMYQYMMTGQGPQEMKDYFFPWDGTYNADGTKHRVSIPSYMKDFFAYAKHPLETAAHKTAPAFNEMIEIFSNKDFYGTQIIEHQKKSMWDSDDTLYKNGLNVLQWLSEDVEGIGKYEGQSLIPFSFKQDPAQQPTTRQAIEQKFGIMPAAKEFQRTDTQNNIITEMAKDYGDEAKTKEAADRITARREVRERLYKGETWDQLPQDLRDRAAYSDKMEKKVIDDASLDPYKRMFRDLKSEGQLDVWMNMTKGEKDDYTQYLNNKQSFIDLHEQKPEVFDDPKTEKAYQEIIGLTHETRGRKKESGYRVFGSGE
jgi:hypothetical protein